MKTCSKCGETKALDEFHRNAAKKDGRTGYCGQCRRRHGQAADPAKARAVASLAARRRRHGLPVRPEGPCAICKKHRRLQVDHDHSTCHPGEQSCRNCQRGLLCGPCNRMLGSARDKVETLQRAIDYLRNPPGIPEELRHVWVDVVQLDADAYNGTYEH